MKLTTYMSHIFILLVQIPYVILGIFCGISVIISNWNEYFVSKEKHSKTVYLLFESSEIASEQETERVRMAA